MKDQAEKALNMALEAFRKRKKSNKEIYIPPHVSECMVDLVLNLLKAL